jgi:hypothetical protein
MFGAQRAETLVTRLGIYTIVLSAMFHRYLEGVKQTAHTKLLHRIDATDVEWDHPRKELGAFCFLRRSTRLAIRYNVIFRWSK